MNRRRATRTGTLVAVEHPGLGRTYSYSWDHLDDCGSFSKRDVHATIDAETHGDAERAWVHDRACAPARRTFMALKGPARPAQANGLGLPPREIAALKGRSTRPRT